MSRCRWGGRGCETPAEEPRRFCAEHAQVLDRVRDEIEEEERRRRAASAVRGRRTILQRCSRFDCSDPRKPGEDICLRHWRLAGG